MGPTRAEGASDATEVEVNVETANDSSSAGVTITTNVTTGVQKVRIF